MIVRRKSMPVSSSEEMFGGTGTTHLISLAPAETLRPLRVLKEMTLEPGASIGYHEHKNETEFFIIKSGVGLVNDNGVETQVARGDVVITGNGSSHGITNQGKKELVFYAVIVTY